MISWSKTLVSALVITLFICFITVLILFDHLSSLGEPFSLNCSIVVKSLHLHSYAECFRRRLHNGQIEYSLFFSFDCGCVNIFLDLILLVFSHQNRALAVYHIIFYEATPSIS